MVCRDVAKNGTAAASFEAWSCVSAMTWVWDAGVGASSLLSGNVKAMVPTNNGRLRRANGWKTRPVDTNRKNGHPGWRNWPALVGCRSIFDASVSQPMNSGR